MARVLSPNCSFYLFEANEAHYDELHKTGHPVFQVLLAAKPATRRFYSIGENGGAVYRESTEHYLKVRPQTVEATTLDLFRESMGLRAPDLIKLDTQGSELEIMRGGL
jgi:FkbM family methyltransferase